MLLLVGLVVDFGQVFSTRARVQSVVDAAALAGAQEFCLPTAQGWSSGNDQVIDARDAAIAFARLDDDFVLDPARITTQTGGVSYLTVSASEPVTLFFGAIADDSDTLGNGAVGAVATASRSCTVNFQFVADTIIEFNGSGSEGGNWYAGECFDGKNNTFDTIAVGTSETHVCSEPSINGDPPPIVRADAGRKLYGITGITAAGAMAGTPMGPYVEGGVADPWLDSSVQKIDCRDVTWSTVPVVCDGDLKGSSKVPDGIVRSDVIMASGDIDMSNNVDFRGRLVYSRNGDITLRNGVPDGVILYAPHGTVTFDGSGTDNFGMVFAGYIRFNGADQDSGQGVDLYAPGDIALVR